MASRRSHARRFEIASSLTQCQIRTMHVVQLHRSFAVLPSASMTIADRWLNFRAIYRGFTVLSHKIPLLTTTCYGMTTIVQLS